jgi:hypothetical protein
MTLIAGFQSNDVPMLMGDFLLTFKDKSLAGLQKKVHRIGPNFVVAWTGNAYVAQVVIGALHNQFRDGRVQRTVVESHLMEFEDFADKEPIVELVGWIMDDRPFCFSWISSRPKEIYVRDHYSAGTGSKLFYKNFIKQESENVNRNFPDTPTKDAVENTLPFLANLIRDEVLGRRNRAEGFGFAYEMLFFEANKFKYLSSILYINLDWYFDTQGKLNDTPKIRPFIKYQSWGDYALVQTFAPEPEPLTELFFMTPIYARNRDIRDTPGLSSILQKAERDKGIPLTSEYYCLLYNLVREDGQFYPFVAAIPHWRDNPYFTIDETVKGRHVFTFERDFVRAVYRSIAASGMQSSDFNPLT